MENKKINAIYIIKANENRLTVDIVDGKAMLYCYEIYRHFRPANYANALAKLQMKMVAEGYSISSKLKTNFADFVILGYSPSVLEKLTDRMFDYEFAYSSGVSSP